LDLALNAEPLDDAMQRERNDDRLEAERDRRGHVKMRRVLDISLPRHSERKDHGVQRIDIQERIEPVLIEQHEADHDEATGKEMGNIECEMQHLETRRDETEQGREQAEYQRRAQELRHAEDAHLGDRDLEEAQQRAADAELHEIGDETPEQRRDARIGARESHWQEEAADQRYIKKKLQRRGELDQREMAAGIFEHHRLVHHGELEMRRRIVDRDARILGERDNDQRDQREAERDAQADFG